MRYKVLLATPTPLYAPLYLAKTLHLGEFANVTFLYGGPPGKESRDPLIDHVVGKYKSRDYLFAVGDPLRAMEVHGPEADPYVVGGLIHHMCYWMIDEGNEYKHDSWVQQFQRVVAHPKKMTGHIIACHHLLSRQGVTDPAYILDYVMPAPTAGSERRWYRTLRAAGKLGLKGTRLRSDFSEPQENVGEPGLHLAYITSNFADLIPETELCRHQFAFYELEEYRDVLMTGLITSKDRFENNQTLFRKLMDDLSRAVDFIRKDPYRAANYLKDYSDPYIDFRDKRIEVGVLRNYLAQLAGSVGAYNENIKIVRDTHVSKAIQLRAQVSGDIYGDIDEWPDIDVLFSLESASAEGFGPQAGMHESHLCAVNGEESVNGLAERYERYKREEEGAASRWIVPVRVALIGVVGGICFICIGRETFPEWLGILLGLASVTSEALPITLISKERVGAALSTLPMILAGLAAVGSLLPVFLGEPSKLYLLGTVGLSGWWLLLVGINAGRGWYRRDARFLRLRWRRVRSEVLGALSLWLRIIREGWRRKNAQLRGEAGQPI